MVFNKSASRLFGRVQVLLEDGWHDSPPDEVTQIFAQIGGGQSRFSITTPRGVYIIDMNCEDGATQTDAQTKKTRKMRFFEDDSLEDLGPAPGSPTSRGELELQQNYGPQSRRGDAPQLQLEVIAHDPHAIERFAELFENEQRHCGEWGVFYHSYSFAALIYEVHAAVAKVLFGFPSHQSPLPRLLVSDFTQTPDAKALVHRFNTDFVNRRKDHTLEYRKVAISAMCSLVSYGPECSIPMVFSMGYSEKDVHFRGVLDGLLEACHVPKKKVKQVGKTLIAICEKYGLDVSQFGGKCSSGKKGHLLQVFVKRRLLDDIAYAAEPYGEVDSTRHPLSNWLNGNNQTHVGQARVVVHPKSFLSNKSVQMYVASADPNFHRTRPAFQAEMAAVFKGILGDAKTRERVATSVYGGMLPAGWTDGAAPE